MKTSRLVAGLAVLGCMLAAGACEAQAQAWPTKTVTIVYGTAPGGPIDLISRVIAAQWEKKFNQRVVVESRPGASSTVAAAYLARAAGDGHTLLNGAFPPVGIFIKELGFDPFKDITPVSIVAVQSYYLLASKHMNISSLKDFIAYAKSNPGKVSVGIVPSGPHETESYAMLETLGIQANLIPYRGLATVYPALVSGELNATLGTTPPQLRSGEIVGLAIGSPKRDPDFPNIPTFRESGFQYEPQASFPFFAPGTTPRELVNRISAEVAAAAKSEDFANRITKSLHIEGWGPDPDTAAKYLREEYDKQKRIAERVGIKPQ